MKITPHFENITQTVIDLLRNSNTNIRICMAWFTDQSIMDVIIEKAKMGISVDLVLFDTQNNRRSQNVGQGLVQLQNFKVALSLFKEAGGNVILIREITDFYLHSKFCVIDNEIVITGSYNWTYPARTHVENIVVIEDDSTSAKFIAEFERIKTKKNALILERFFPDCTQQNCNGKLIKMRLYNYNKWEENEYSEDYADFQVCNEDITHIHGITHNDTWKPYFYDIYEIEFNRLQLQQDSESVNEDTLKNNINIQLANYVGSRTDLFSTTIANDILILGKVSTQLIGKNDEEDVIQIIWNHEIADGIIDEIKYSVEPLLEILNK